MQFQTFGAILKGEILLTGLIGSVICLRDAQTSQVIVSTFTFPDLVQWLTMKSNRLAYPFGFYELFVGHSCFDSSLSITVSFVWGVFFSSMFAYLVFISLSFGKFPPKQINFQSTLILQQIGNLMSDNENTTLIAGAQLRTPIWFLITARQRCRHEADTRPRTKTDSKSRYRKRSLAQKYRQQNSNQTITSQKWSPVRCQGKPRYVALSVLHSRYLVRTTHSNYGLTRFEFRSI